MSRLATTAPFALAGLFWTAAQAIQPDIGLETAERYDHVVDARGLESLSGGLFVVAGALLVLSGLAASRRLAEIAPARGGRLLTVGAALVALGGVWLAAGRGAFNLSFVKVTGPDVDPDSALAVLDSAGGTGFVPLVLTLPCLLLGPVLVGVGLRRAGLAGWLPLALWLIGVGTFLATEFTAKAGEIAGIALAAAALALVGRALDTGSAATTPAGVGSEPARLPV